MNTVPHPLDEAALLVGGRAKLARRLCITSAAIGNWKARGVPIEYCPEIERITEQRVCRKDLRPSDWQRIWPELADAQPVATAQQGVGHV